MNPHVCQFCVTIKERALWPLAPSALIASLEYRFERFSYDISREGRKILRGRLNLVPDLIQDIDGLKTVREDYYKPMKAWRTYSRADRQMCNIMPQDYRHGGINKSPLGQGANRWTVKLAARVRFQLQLELCSIVNVNVKSNPSTHTKKKIN